MSGKVAHNIVALRKLGYHRRVYRHRQYLKKFNSGYNIKRNQRNRLLLIYLQLTRLTKLIILGCLNNQNYLLLIASTGFILAALEAGKIPASIPTTRQIITVPPNNGNEINMGKSAALVRMSVSM